MDDNVALQSCPGLDPANELAGTYVGSYDWTRIHNGEVVREPQEFAAIPHPR